MGSRLPILSIQFSWHEAAGGTHLYSLSRYANYDFVAFRGKIYPEALAEGSRCKILCLYDEILHFVQDKFCRETMNLDRI
jgi:hypothetical protein